MGLHLSRAEAEGVPDMRTQDGGPLMPAALQPLYVSDREAATLLGRSVDWLRANAGTLEAVYGFPKIDPAVGKRHRPAIERWAEQRNAPRPMHMTQSNPERIGNHDKF